MRKKDEVTIKGGREGVREGGREEKWEGQEKGRQSHD